MYNFNFTTAQGQLMETIVAPSLDRALNTLCVLRGHNGHITEVSEKGFFSGRYKVTYYLSTWIDYEVSYTKETSQETEEIVLGEFV